MHRQHCLRWRRCFPATPVFHKSRKERGPPAAMRRDPRVRATHVSGSRAADFICGRQRQIFAANSVCALGAFRRLLKAVARASGASPISEQPTGNPSAASFFCSATQSTHAVRHSQLRCERSQRRHRHPMPASKPLDAEYPALWFGFCPDPLGREMSELVGIHGFSHEWRASPRATENPK